jgi:L-ribulose-5-phosphate 3-epimerase UlaE
MQAAEDADVRRLSVASSGSVFGLSYNPPDWPPKYLPVDEDHPCRPTEFYSLSKRSLLVENMPFAFLPGISELMDALDRFGSSEIGVVYDIANGHFFKEDIADRLRKAKPRLALVQLSDTGQTVYRHDAVGLGTVPFSVVPSVLSEIGHRKLPMLEIISADADSQIDDSAQRLAEMGFGAAA